jgi:hypothetical protein
LSAVKKIEQGTLESLRLETAHRLAVALGLRVGMAVAAGRQQRSAITGQERLRA